MVSLQEVLDGIDAFSGEEKRQLYLALRNYHVVHELEARWKVRADVILTAIDRGSDLTQRGIRGVIAESIFALEIVPDLEAWKDTTPPGNLAYDVRLSKDGRDVRIQVKMQRRKAGVPLIRKGSFAVEVQRTRTGQDGDIKTRPYRFEEFDLIAVCMEPSAGDWRSFMYAPTASLQADKSDSKIIQTFQAVPPFRLEPDGIWCGDLAAALQNF